MIDAPVTGVGHSLRPTGRCATCRALVPITHPSLTLEGGNVPVACAHCGAPVTDVRLRRIA